MRDTLTPFLSQAGSPSTGRLRRSLFVGVFVALVAVALVVPPAAVGDGAAADDWPWEVQPGEDSDQFPLVGELSFRNEDGTQNNNVHLLGFDPGLHLAVFYDGDTRAVRLVDTRTLEKLDIIDIDVPGVGHVDFPTARIDTDNHRLFIAALTTGAQVRDRAGVDDACDTYEDTRPEDDEIPFPASVFSGVLDYPSNVFCNRDDPSAQPQPAILTISLTGEHEPVAAALEVDLAPEEEALQTDVKTKLGYHPPTDKVYAVTESKPMDMEGSMATNPYTTVHEFRAADLVAPSGGSAAAVWSHQLASCDKPDTWLGGFVARSLRGDFVYIPCRGASQSATASWGMHGAVRVDLNDGSGPSDTSQFVERFHPLAADLGLGGATGDAANDLLLFVQNGGDKRLFTFDAHQEAWTGSTTLPQTGNVRGLTTNSETGRIYSTTEGSHGLAALRVTEGSRVVVPNGTAPDLGLTKVEPKPAVWVDPSTRRLFIHKASMCFEWTEEYESGDWVGPSDAHASRCADGETRDTDTRPQFRVFEDRTSPAPPPEPVDWDDRTEDVADGPAFTQSGANGTAYGARYLFAGGIRGSRPASTGKQTDRPILAGPAGPAGRQMIRGHVREASLSRVTSTPTIVGSAAGLTIGEQTGSDVKRNSDIACAPAAAAAYPSSANPEAPYVPFPCLPDDWQRDDPEEGERELYRRWDGSNWPDEFPEEMRGYEAACDDFGGEPSEDAKPGAAVSCDSLEPVGQAGALYTATDEQAPVQVGYAETSVEVREDEQLGAVATATAVARDIDLFGQISIGEIRTEATAVAHGRPGTAATELTREYRQVRIGDGFACGWGKDDPCDAWEIVRAINDLSQPRLTAYVPAADTSLNPAASDEPDDQPGEARVSNGTPGGARAIVTLDKYDAQSNKAINEDTRTELPGLQIVYYDDHSETSRHIFQFAAVNLDTFYYISAVPTFDPPDWANGGGDGFGDDTGSGGGLPGDLGGAATRGVTPPSVMALGEEPVAPAEEPDVNSSAPTSDADGFAADDGTSGLEQGQAPSLGTAEGPALDTGQDAPAPEVAPDASSGEQSVVAQGDQGGSSGPGGLMLTRQRMGETVPLAVLWVLAALPFYLAVRRRRLLTSSTR